MTKLRDVSFKVTISQLAISGINDLQDALENTLMDWDPQVKLIDFQEYEEEDGPPEKNDGVIFYRGKRRIKNDT